MGQLNSLTATQMRMYPRLEKWCLVLSRFTDNGRNTTFTNAFTRQHGLEAVQMRISELDARPRYCCADSEVDVSRDAKCPVAAVRLEIKRP